MVAKEKKDKLKAGFTAAGIAVEMVDCPPVNRKPAKAKKSPEEIRAYHERIILKADLWAASKRADEARHALFVRCDLIASEVMGGDANQQTLDYVAARRAVLALEAKIAGAAVAGTQDEKEEESNDGN